MNLNQVTVACSSVPRSITFYETLGLRLIVHTHDKYARFECPEGEATFSLHWVEQMPAIPNATIYFEVADLDAAYSRLTAAGIAFEHPPVMQTWRWREALLKDPDGNPIILFQAGENRLNPPWRLAQ
jgi:catechol 2,3-dioxygenase-like lactoylglutathione lyase family enzyme